LPTPKPNVVSTVWPVRCTGGEEADLVAGFLDRR